MVVGDSSPRPIRAATMVLGEEDRSQKKRWVNGVATLVAVGRQRQCSIVAGRILREQKYKMDGYSTIVDGAASSADQQNSPH